MKAWLNSLQNFSDYLILFACIISCIILWVNFKNSEGKHKTVLFLISLIGCSITYLGARHSLETNKKRKEVINGYMTGGTAFPVIKFELENDPYHYTFFVCNDSTDYTLYDIKVRYVRVSTADLFVYDDWAPQVILSESFLQPKAKVATDFGGSTEQFDTVFNELKAHGLTPELRYNFFIRCKNGTFYEQLIIRKVNDQFESAVQVKKNNEIIFKTQLKPGFLWPGEKKLIFQDDEEGQIKGTIDEERNKWRKRI